MFLYFLLVIAILKQLQGKIFTVPLTKMSNSYYLHCSIGKPFQRIYFAIDLENEYSFTNTFIYHKGKSLYYLFHSAKEIKVESLKIDVEEVSDLFELYKQDIIQGVADSKAVVDRAVTLAAKILPSCTIKSAVNIVQDFKGC